MKQKLLIFLTLLTFTVGQLYAYDFSAANSDGVEIYYNIIDNGNTVEVTSRSYTGLVTIPQSVVWNNEEYLVISIADGAFKSCKKLTSVILPNSITSIGKNAFLGCVKLNTISIPNSVSFIGDGAFANCENLTSFEIPNSITSIGENVFSNCSGLQTISIPNSVTTIGDNAFRYCSSLNTLSLPNSITEIGNNAFYSCTGLKSVIIPESVTYMAGSVFAFCSSLATITLPNSIEGIGAATFANCSSLTSITLPNSISYIGDRAFDSCIGLKSISIPNSVTSIGDRAFVCCKNLTSFEIPNSVTSIKEYAFCECTSLSSIKLPDNLEYLGNGTFFYCYNLKSISIPNSIASIGENTFYGCLALRSIALPESLETIGDCAFYDCAGLATATIPPSVHSIGSQAFKNCNGLQSITVKWPNPDYVALGSNVFDNTGNCELQVPKGLKSLYEATEPWNKFRIVEGEPLISEVLPEDVYAQIEGIYTCNGDGETFNLGISIYPEDDEKYLKKVIIYGWKGYEWAQIECDFSFNAFTGGPNLSIPVGTPVALDVDFGDIGVCNVYVLKYTSKGLYIGGTIDVAGNEDVSELVFQNGIAGGVFSGEAIEYNFTGHALFAYQTLTMSKQLGSIDEVNAPDTDDITITTNGGELQIHNTFSGEPVALYTLMGQMLYSGITTDAVTTVPVNLSKGTICILRVGANTRKVVF